MSQFATFLNHVQSNLGLMVVGGVVGGAVTKLNLTGPVSRFPAGIATNLELASALESLEDVLPNPLIMKQLIMLCETLCRLEFGNAIGTHYQAAELMHLIKQELGRFKIIPWLSEDMDAFETSIMQAVQCIQSNIHHEYASR